MKSKMTHTIVSRCFAFGAIVISLITCFGCHCNSSRWSVLQSRSDSVRAGQAARNGKAASIRNRAERSEFSAERSGLLIDLQKAMASSRPSANTENVTKSSHSSETVASPKTAEVSASPTVVADANVQSSRRSVLTSTKRDAKTSQPGEAPMSVTDSKSEPLVAETKAKQNGIQEPKKLNSADEKSPANPASRDPNTPRLKPVAKFEPPSLPSVPKQSAEFSSMESVAHAEPAMQPVKLNKPSTANRPAIRDHESIQNPSTLANSASQRPTVLPRATAKLNRRVPENTFPESANGEFASSPPTGSDSVNPQAQPLVLELRDGDWPVYGDVDPVARAYETHKKSKPQYRNLDESQTLVHDHEPSNSPMRMAGHRRQMGDTQKLDSDALTFEEAALLHDRSNWIPVETPTKQQTGLQLKAMPQSADVPISPVVRMTPSSSSRFSDGDPVNESKMQPLEWPSQTDSHDLLPLDEIGPIIDLPVSESIRRLTVRPDSAAEEKTIER